MGTETKSTFDPEKIKATVSARVKNAFDRTLSDAIVDIQTRLDAGRSITGRTYNYARDKNGKESYYMKSRHKVDPVTLSDTGTLRRSIDFVTELKQDKLEGRIGVKDLQRGKTSNSVILQSLIKRFPGLWGLSKAEIANLYNNFVKYFKS